jgi:hypothetical protein
LILQRIQNRLVDERKIYSFANVASHHLAHDVVLVFPKIDAICVMQVQGDSQSTMLYVRQGIMRLTPQ